jgi:4-hydroxymandelate oxidase
MIPVAAIASASGARRPSVKLSRRDALFSAAGMAVAGLKPTFPESLAREGSVVRNAEGNGFKAGDAVSVLDFEAPARAAMSPMAYEYVAGGAGDEATIRWNREAYERIRLRPRALVDVSHLDTRVRLFGDELSLPVLLAPTAYHRLYHPEGERATARGASAAGVTYVVSSFSTTAIEDIARETREPLWFQLYVQPDRGFTRHMIERAQDAGCRALCVTVDTPVAGARNREERLRFSLPPGLELPHLKGLKTAAADHQPSERSIFSSVLDPTLTWKDVEWMRSFARVPILLKGVLDSADAEQAVKAGASGVIVSNHGGRNLDTVPATIEALPAVVERVAGRVPVLVDGGIRRGTDILKALASGATAVLIGRPYLYGLGAAGEAGVARVVEILRRELDMALALSGRPSVRDLDRTVLW